MKTYLFPGQGSQYQGMGEGLFDAFPELTQKADRILGYSIKDLCLVDVQQQLNQTQFTQPALYVVNALAYQKKLQDTGDLPDFVAGHSLGEYNALQSAGAISFEDGLKLVKKRGELMSKAPKGAMMAVLGASEQDIKKILQDNALTGIDVANYNSPTQIIISGLEQDIHKADLCFADAQIRAIPLNTSGAFHSRYMVDAQREFEAYLKKFTFGTFQFPVMSNVHARPYAQQEIVANLASQISHSVRWTESIQYLLRSGVTEFEELGAGTVLTRLISAIKTQSPPSAINPEAKTTDCVCDTKAQTPEQQSPSDKVKHWNNTYPIGTKVLVKSYDAPLITKSSAVLLFGHRAAIYLQGYNGYFALDDIKPV